MPSSNPAPGRSLADLRPDIAREWHSAMNPQSPENTTASSNKAVWWECGRGHHYRAVVANRTRRGIGCMYCSGHAPLRGYNDLATTRPDISAEWDASNDSAPANFTAGSNKKVNWRCASGHVWTSDIKGE